MSDYEVSKITLYEMKDLSALGQSNVERRVDAEARRKA